MNSEAFKTGYEFLDNVLDLVGNPVKVLYEGVLRKAVYGEKEHIANGMDQAVDDMVSLMFKISEGLVDNVKEEVFTNPRKHFDRFVSYVYNLHKEEYNRQKSNNNFEMAWREGLWEKVARNEISIQEAAAKMNEVMAKKAQYEKEHFHKFADILVEIKTDEQTGEEQIVFREVAETSDGASLESRAAPVNGDADMIFKKLDKYINHSQYGRLDYMTILYNYYKSASAEKWEYQRHPSTEQGKLTLQSHNSHQGMSGVKWTKWKNPFYKVDLHYENDKDYNNYGTVRVRLWLSPSGTILNTYIIDSRRKHDADAFYHAGEAKRTGEDWPDLKFDE